MSDRPQIERLTPRKKPSSRSCGTSGSRLVCPPSPPTAKRPRQRFRTPIAWPDWKRLATGSGLTILRSDISVLGCLPRRPLLKTNCETLLRRKPGHKRWFKFATKSRNNYLSDDGTRSELKSGSGCDDMLESGGGASAHSSGRTAVVPSDRPPAVVAGATSIKPFHRSRGRRSDRPGVEPTRGSETRYTEGVVLLP